MAGGEDEVDAGERRDAGESPRRRPGRPRLP